MSLPIEFRLMDHTREENIKNDGRTSKTCLERDGKNRPKIVVIVEVTKEGVVSKEPLTTIWPELAGKKNPKLDTRFWITTYIELTLNLKLLNCILIFWPHSLK